MRERDPWREADRRPGVEVRLAPLPEECGGAVVQRRPERIWIVIDPSLSPVDQRCRLAHELVHLDRGSSTRCRWMPRSWDAKVAQEEMHVDAEVAAWLIDQRDLWLVVRSMLAAGEDVTARVIAAEFEVTKPIARAALDRLQLTSGHLLSA